VSSPRLEAFLARIYVDRAARDAFLAAPLVEARRAGLTPDECAGLLAIDRPGLLLAAASFERKRERSSHARDA